MTKSEAIENHRKMWNWIADQYEDEHGIHLMTDEMKNLYIKDNLGNNATVFNECFLCDYAFKESCSMSSYCRYCPLEWPDKKEYDGFFCETKSNNRANWVQCLNFSYKEQFKDAARIARAIANLPEKIPEA